MKPYYEHAGITIYHGDCREVMPTLGASAALITDPPYGIGDGAAFVRSFSKIEEHGSSGFNQEVVGWRESVVLMSDAWIAEFCSSRLGDMDRVRAGHRSAGWKEWRLFLIVKTAPPPTPRATMVSAWEPALISKFGNVAWGGGGYVPDRWIGLTPNRLGVGQHPSEKPGEAMRILVESLSSAGDTVLDPFCGSGTTLRAAKDLGRRAIGIEIEERYCEIAARRCAQEVMDLRSLGEDEP